MPPRFRSTPHPFVMGLLGLACVLALVAARMTPPAANGLEAPLSQFSAARAAAVLEALIEGTPHPVGSPANAAVRGRLLAKLTDLGYQTEIQTAFACNDGGVCAEVHNVLARRAGPEAGPLVLLMTHYDSVGAGPGASDDGLGTAALLETARVLASRTPTRNPLLLLVTDGEEPGLLGAQAFVLGHRLAGRVAVVVNLEARGTSGPSLLFETSGPSNGWLVRQAAALPRPATSSVFAAIYDRLPNDTDLSVFKRRGVPGLNFAVIGEPRHYHTPRDDLGHLDRRSLQQHGDNLLALARRLGEADIASPSPGRLAFFDVFGLFIARWPQALQPWLAGLTLGSLLLIVWRRRAKTPPARALLACLAFLLAFLMATASAFALTQLWRHTLPGPRAWIAAGWAPVLAAWSCGLAGPTLSALIFRRRLTPAASWAGSWLVWALLALATARLLPGAAYLFVVPSLAAAVCGLLLPRLGARGPSLAALLPVFLAASLAFPLAWLLYDGLGLPLTPAIAGLVALVVAPLAPLLPPSAPALRLLLAPLLGLVAGGAATAMLPPDSIDRPQRLPLLYVEADDGAEGRLLAVPESGRLPESVSRSLSFGASPERALPWSRSARAFAARVPAAGLAPPELTVQSDRQDGGKRRLRLRLTSPRGAPAAALAFQGAMPPIEAATVTSRGRPPVSVRSRLLSALPLLQFATLPPEGIELDLVLGAPQSIEVIVADQSSGLPPLGQPLSAARPPTAVTSQDGDVTVVWRRLKL